jgi:hypothetical protein
MKQACLPQCFSREHVLLMEGRGQSQVLKSQMSPLSYEVSVAWDLCSISTSRELRGRRRTIAVQPKLTRVK